MKTLICLLLFPVLISAQTTDSARQLVALTISYEPDQTDAPNKFYLIADKPACVSFKENQTFLLQSTWHKEGDSIVTIGMGTGKILNDSTAELNATVLTGKKVQKGDIALFLVALKKPADDTLFFKMARLGIVFTTVDDSSFYNRNTMLQTPRAYPTIKLLEAMAADIRRTGDAMIALQNSQDQKISSGIYKDKMLFAIMQKVVAADVAKFIYYVYARPDKYKAHEWKVSETFATWAINGSPQVISAIK